MLWLLPLSFSPLGLFLQPPLTFHGYLIGTQYSCQVSCWDSNATDRTRPTLSGEGFRGQCWEPGNTTQRCASIALVMPSTGCVTLAECIAKDTSRWSWRGRLLKDERMSRQTETTMWSPTSCFVQDWTSNFTTIASTWGRLLGKSWQCWR